MKKIGSLFIVLLATSACLLSCSEQVYEYEEMVRLESKALNQNLSEIEIKKWAIYLSNWSEPDFYKREIQKFLKKDSIKFPKKRSILFIGSSSIVYWNNLKKDMSPFEVLNRGFGGAHIAHVNNHFHEIIIPYEPRGIVFFCGTNDIAALKSPIRVFDDFLIFYRSVKSALPQTKVFVIGVKPSLARHHLRGKQLILNKFISELANEEENLTFIDVWQEMLLENNEANPKLFVEDGLHMNSKGYAIWTKLVKSYLESTFEPDKS